VARDAEARYPPQPPARRAGRHTNPLAHGFTKRRVADLILPVPVRTSFHNEECDVLNEQFPKDSIYISWGRLRTAVVGALRDCRCRDRLGAVRGRTLAGLVLTDGSRPRGRVKLPGEGVSLEGATMAALASGEVFLSEREAVRNRSKSRSNNQAKTRNLRPTATTCRRSWCRNRKP
jgi:hypothetical protein